MSHFTFRLPYVLFCGVVIHTFSVVPFYFWASIRSFLRCRYTYFFRLSHFAFGLPYVLFCGVVIHTFFVKMITRKTRFLQLFVVVKQQYDINCDSPFGHEPLGYFYIFGNKLDQTYLKCESNQRHCPKGTYLYMSNSNFIRLSHFTFKLPYVLFCGVGIHTFFGKMITRKTRFLQLFVVIKQQ